MPRTPAFVVLVTVTGALLAACGSSSSDSTSSATAASTSMPSNAASSGTHRAAAGHQRTQGSAAAAPASAAPRSGNGSGGGGAAAPASADPAVPQGGGGAQPVPFPPPGSYTYRVNGSSSSALGKQSLDGDSTLAVDQPQGNSEHSVQRDKGGSTEQTLVSHAGGLYLSDLHLSQSGFDEEFKPVGRALLFPARAHQGQRWHWRMRSTDGNYTLTADLEVSDLHSTATTTSGQRVKTVSLSSVLHLRSSDINLTIHQQDQAGRDAVIVREHAVTDGTAYGTPVHSDATRVLSDRP